LWDSNFVVVFDTIMVFGLTPPVLSEHLGAENCLAGATINIQIGQVEIEGANPCPYRADGFPKGHKLKLGNFHD
jgi:hypothetical protein